MEIPSGPRVPPPGAGASPYPDTNSNCSDDSPFTGCRTPRHNRYRVVVPLPSFGRSRSANRAANSARRADRTKPAADEPATDDPELASYLAALSPESDLESTGSGRRFGEAQVYQLRLSLAASHQLKELATQLGTSPQALVQEWVMERLASEKTPHGAPRPGPQPPEPQPATQEPSAFPSREPFPADEDAEAVTEELFLDQHQWPSEAVSGRLN